MESAYKRGDEWSIKIFNCSQILPLLDLLAKFKRVLACSCSPNFCVARKLAKQIFYFCSYSQKNRSARHARECSQRPFVTPYKQYDDRKAESGFSKSLLGERDMNFNML